MAEQHEGADPQHPRLGVRGEELTGYAVAFGALFVVGFGVVLFVVMRGRGRGRGPR